MHFLFKKNSNFFRKTSWRFYCAFVVHIGICAILSNQLSKLIHCYRCVVLAASNGPTGCTKCQGQATFSNPRNKTKTAHKIIQINTKPLKKYN